MGLIIFDGGLKIEKADTGLIIFDGR